MSSEFEEHPAGSVDPNVMDFWQVLMQMFGFEVTVVNQNPWPWPLLLKDEYKKPCLIAWNQGMNQ
jgi:hypothetical protein